MRLIAFITHSANIRQILDHIGVESEAPHISPARGPPLREDCDAQMDDAVHIEPDLDLAAQPAPDYEPLEPQEQLHPQPPDAAAVTVADPDSGVGARSDSVELCIPSRASRVRSASACGLLVVSSRSP